MQNTKRTLPIGNFALLLWMIPVLSVFMYYPGRVSYIYWGNLSNLPLLSRRLGIIAPFQYTANWLLAVAGVFIFSFACISFGLFLSKITGADRLRQPDSILDKLSYISTQFLLGQGVFSLLFLGMGGLYRITAPSVLITLVIGTILGMGQVKNTLQNTFPLDKLQNKQEKIILWLSILILIFALFLASARISYDSSAIYFSNAKITAQTGYVAFFAKDTFVASVFHSVIQFTAIIQLFGDQSARMFSWVHGLIIIIFSLALGEKVGLTRSARLILLALLLTSTAFTDLLGDGKVDLISSAPAIAAIYWMTAKNQTLEKARLILIGFFCGLAIIGRPFNAFLLAIFVLLFYFQDMFLGRGFNLSNLKTFAGSLFWISSGAIGLGIYHLFTNWMLLGSPFAFLSSLTSINPASGPWDADPQQMLALRLLYPFIATFRNTPQSLGNISPLVIAFLPALFLKNIRAKVKFSQTTIRLTIIAIITIIFWIFTFFTVVEIRYVFFLWAIIFIPVADIISRVFQSEDRIFRNLTFGILTFLLGFFVLRTAFIAIDTYSPLDSQGNPQCSNFPLCDYLKTINQAALPGERVLTLGAYRYYLRSDLFACSTRYEEYQTLQKLTGQSAKNFWEEIYREGYAYIAYENDYTTRHLRFEIIPGPDNVPIWMRLERIDNTDSDLLAAYKIHAINPPIQVETSCENNNQGKWELKTKQP